MMSRVSDLDQLCALCGIETEYHDVWGNRHEVALATRRALLQAMGVAAGSDKEIAHALALRRQRSWQRTLAPVQVVRNSTAPVKLTLTLAGGQAEELLEWTLRLEDGRQHAGRVRPDELDVLERATIDDVLYLRYALPLPLTPPPGYHRFELRRTGQVTDRLSLIIVPDRCYKPPVLAEGGRVWGPALQLYALRSERNWGIGDFSDLQRIAGQRAREGVNVVGVNPLHALFPHNPEHASPYSPSSRLYLNVLYLDVEAVPDFSECQPARKEVANPAFQARLQALRESELVDYAGVSKTKLQLLRHLYKHFCKHHLQPRSERGTAFRTFVEQAGDTLYRHALFEALQAHFHASDATIWGWPVWPQEYRDPASTAVQKFSQTQREQIEFFQYLQWQADQQLGAVGRRAEQAHLGIGLYADLAVSVDRGGAEAWANQKLYALDASIGAPPDDYNLHGQNWGLPPFIPEALVEAGYTPFIAMLRANMRHAGALRIDHVMGLMRLFWVPGKGTPDEGAYVHYAFEDLLGILALESQRNHCFVIGEDLGTVPEVVRTALLPLGVLSYRLFYFEKDDQAGFRPPSGYTAQAVVSASTHDLPTLAGFWLGDDLHERDVLHLFPSDAVRDQQMVGRAEDRARLLYALKREGLLPADMSVDPQTVPEMTPALAHAIHHYLARTASQVMLVQLEDIIGQRHQVNLPGTTDQRPNWRYKLALTLEEIWGDARWRALAVTLRDTRGLVPGAAPPVPLRTASIPRVTYRLQFNRDFTFSQACELVPYLARLGISHAYASPYLKARAGSQHGYDIVDHASINPEIGSTDDYEDFVQALHKAGMAQILDIVPNHMGVAGNDNQWWLDVLENGRASAYAGYFDIDWRPEKDALRGKVLLPVLGDYYGKVLEKGELKLAFDAEAGSLAVHYCTHLFPIDPKNYAQILSHALERLQRQMGEDNPQQQELQTLITAFRNLPPHHVSTEERIRERNRDQAVHKRHLAELARAAPTVRQFIEENVATFNGGGETADFNLLHELLEQQAYRLAYWRVASDEINYRRFFDVDELAGLRMENPDVFEATHRVILELVAQGKVDGLRIDHPDGLYDPAAYFAQLQQQAAVLTAQHNGSDTPADSAPLYIVAEKILAHYERLPEEWPIHGTTGYDFAVLVNGLQIYGPSEREFDRIYRRFTGHAQSFDELLYERKKLIMGTALSSELHVLASELDRISESDWHTRDYTLTTLRNALSEVVACFPVYRTYVTGAGVSEEDRRYVEWAVAQAKKRSLAADVSIYDFIRDILLLQALEGKSGAYRQMAVTFAMRFQQYTSPVMAKGMEDTLFYIYNRLVSLNDVGGDPRRYSVSVAAFHNANQERLKRWPHTMLATSTHDAKRSEDVRARINVLSEVPEQWWQRLARWSRLNRHKKRRLDEHWVPSRNDEYLLYQTLVGVWPLEVLDDTGLAALRERIEAYMLKAIKEAKVHTSWINPNTGYEEAMQHFVRALLGSVASPFVTDLWAFKQRIARFGLFNSLSQTLLKLTAPGVPDIYQGSELWDFSLVDPDNRRPVDYGLRQQWLAEVEDAIHSNPAAQLQAMLDHMEDGRIKLYLTWKALALRHALPQLFQLGSYQPLAVEGAQAGHVCAYARRHENDVVVIVTTHWFARLLGDSAQHPVAAVWSDTWIETPAQTAGVDYTDVLSGEIIRSELHEGRTLFAAERLLARFPLALLRARLQPEN
ncbi:MAG: malto-oligosyltrehalose synthase [Gammaproteobacteria bacterium]|nr:malto-oligosyltrehalose synthase [Gammaproteobacteria bacterium]